MRWPPAATVALSAAALAACSLAISTNGLTGGDPPASTPDASLAEEASLEGPPDTGPTDAAGPGPLEGGTDEAGPRDDGGAPDADAGNDAAVAPTGESCAAIHAKAPAAPTGQYLIQPAGRAPVTVTCEMSLSGGGWTLAVAFDAATTPCPPAWTFDADAQGCRRSTDGVDSATFTVPLARFRETLLSMTGSQRHSPDGFVPAGTTLDAAYVDGVSVTTLIGSARAHVFTFAVGLTDDAAIEPASHCPCDTGGAAAPGVVGSAFLCDTAMRTGYPANAWLGAPLWDGDARGLGTCATGASPRFVTSRLAQESTSPLEVRLMADQDRENEDVAIRKMTIYVR